MSCSRFAIGKVSICVDNTEQAVNLQDVLDLVHDYLLITQSAVVCCLGYLNDCFNTEADLCKMCVCFCREVGRCGGGIVLVCKV